MVVIVCEKFPILNFVRFYLTKLFSFYLIYYCFLFLELNFIGEIIIINEFYCIKNHKVEEIVNIVKRNFFYIILI